MSFSLFQFILREKNIEEIKAESKINFFKILFDFSKSWWLGWTGHWRLCHFLLGIDLLCGISPQALYSTCNTLKLSQYTYFTTNNNMMIRRLSSF